ncbi:MAG: VCBS repeat-containing protein [Candidatus Eisenbacteria bacterium]|nr:VCBS repeat-containing protein [Candidatus Eisenbacteria bacterium]
MTRIRTTLLVIAALSALLVGCSTREEYVDAAIGEARSAAAMRDYARAHEILDAAMSHTRVDFRLAYEKAEILKRAHLYTDAADWYARAAAIDSSSWKAVAGMWEAAYLGEGKSAEAAARVLSEAMDFLSAAPDSIANLSAAVRAGIVVDKEDAVAEARERLLRQYPDSELASDLIKEDVDWIGVERDDETRLSMCDTFLDRYPVTEWRPRVMRLKLVSLKRLGRLDDVETLAREWGEAHKSNAELLDIIAAVLVSCRRAPTAAVEFSTRAVELTLAECDSLGLGVEDSGGRMSLVPENGDAPDQETIDELVNRLASRFLTRATALAEAGSFPECRSAAAKALAWLDIDENDEETGSAYHYVLGRAEEGMNNQGGAFEEYLKAVMVGGRQNRWPARADTALRRVYEIGQYRGTSRDAHGDMTLEDFAREHVGYDGPVFTDVTTEAGLGGRNQSRVAWGDCDGDGYDDLLLSGCVLMRNGGDGTFDDVTAQAGVGGTGSNGGVWADIDNDGDLDFYATSGATSGENTDRLWINRGDGTFEDGTEAAGRMTDLYTTEGAAWGDYDADGLVDLYLASYERPRTDDFDEYGVGFPDILYRNLGGGVFVDVTDAAGMEPPFGAHLSGRGVNWGDYDNDGDLDVFVSNYRLQEDFLWRNEGDGTFVNVAPSLGASGRETDGWWGHTIGSEWGDFDNDGDLDLFSANLAHPRYIEVSDMSMLLENGGPPEWAFLDRRAGAGIKYAETHSDPAWGDMDADGDLDLFITSIYPDCGTFLYLNDGKGRFQDVTWLAGVRSFNGWGCAMSDYDLDGDLDIAVASGSGFRLFRNDGPRRGPANHWLEVRVAGTHANAAGIGARITVSSGESAQIREIQGGKGTTSQHSLTAFFGLGREGGPVSVVVRFPGGGTERLDNVEVDQRIVIHETR